MGGRISVIRRISRRLEDALSSRPAIRGALSECEIDQHSARRESEVTDPVVNAGSDRPEVRRKREAPWRNRLARVDDGHILPGRGARQKKPHGQDLNPRDRAEFIAVPDEVTSPGPLVNLENQTGMGAPAIRTDSPARAFSLSGRGRLLPDRCGSKALLLLVLFCVVSAL